MGQAGHNAFGLCCIEQCPGMPGQLSLGGYARRGKHDREVTGKVCKDSAPSHISRAKRKGRQRPDEGQHKNDRTISVHFQGKPFSQVYALTSNTEEAEVEYFYENLQDLLELTPKKDVLFIIGDWDAKVRNQEIPGVTGTLVLEYRMKQRKG